MGATNYRPVPENMIITLRHLGGGRWEATASCMGTRARQSAHSREKAIDLALTAWWKLVDAIEHHERLKVRT